MLEKCRAIWALMAGHRLRYLAAIGVLVLATCFTYLAPLVVQATLDGVLLARPDGASWITSWVVERLGGQAYVAANLWLPALLVGLLAAAAGCFTYLRGRWGAQATEAIAVRVRDRVYDQLQRQPLGYLDKAETGDLIQRATADVETLRTFLSSQVVEIGRAGIMLLVPIPLMLLISPAMTLVSLIFIPPIFGFSFLFFPKVRKLFLAVDEAEGRLTANIQENLTGIRVVRAFARQAHEREKFAARNQEVRDLDLDLFKLIAVFWSVSDALCHVQSALVVGVGAWLLASGELGVGAFYFFIQVSTLYVHPVRMAGRIITDLGKATVAVDRLLEVLDAASETDAERALDGSVLPKGELVFEGVSFAHGETPVLEDLDLTVPAGTTLGILGPSGAGKSTLVSLLLRLYDYDAGSIRLDGQELNELDRQDVRHRLAVVLQEPFLYSRPLGENLRLGRWDAPQDEVEEAARQASIHATIAGFDQGYATRVGERGVTLSGGQRQRVALARALLQKPAVLILDDSLSAVDTETEAQILQALRERQGQQTTIVIAHRLSCLTGADQIVVLDEGRIVQRGTHASLAAEDGPYRRLWQIQTGDAVAPPDPPHPPDPAASPDSTPAPAGAAQ